METSCLWPVMFFKAIKPEEVGSLVRFDFIAESSAKLRFSFGRSSDGMWTPIEMPFHRQTSVDPQACPFPPSRVGCTAQAETRGATPEWLTVSGVARSR